MMSGLLGARASSMAKGKQRAQFNIRDDGSGGATGMVLNLDMVSTSYDTV